MKQALPQRLEKIADSLVCPACRAGLDFSPGQARCRDCGQKYPIKNNKIYFVTGGSVADETDRLKGRLKKLLGPLYYSIGIPLLSPIYPFNFGREVGRRIDPAQNLVIDIGSGNQRIHPDIICLDFMDYPEVDLVCDMHHLPFAIGSLDATVSCAVLEHVRNPWLVVEQMGLVTRPGGLGIHLIPFLQPFHAAPEDFYRFTAEGQKLLFQDWSIQEQFNTSGPFSVLAQTLVETLTIAFSLGNRRIRPYPYLVFLALLFPIKFLDAPFVRRKSFLDLAASIVSVFEKK